MDFEIYSGQECYALENAALRLLIPRDIGPRVLWFGFRGGENLFADLPNFTADLSGGRYHFYGGHRLWAAPESFSTTYAADDFPVEVTPMDGGLVVTKPIEPRTGLQKSLEILLSDDTRVVIQHRITNRNSHPLTCAPWAITQFRTGGVAILPQANHDMGVLPNRLLALWSYTDISNPNVIWGKEYLLAEARMDTPFKVGFPNPRGWLAYWLDGAVFVKRAEYDAQKTYYDFGSSSECYCNDQFLELETLAPGITLGPNETATHIETWELHRDIERPRSVGDVGALAEKLNLA
jgi:hypothetical protein